MAISLDQIYGAITGYDPAKLQEIQITPSSSTQTFDESNLNPGMIGFLPITVEAVQAKAGGRIMGIGTTHSDLGVEIADSTTEEPATAYQDAHLFPSHPAL